MKYSFFCFGHENLTSMHDKTIEFTKDVELTLNGDCIAGVKADFDFDKLLEFIRVNEKKKIKCIIQIEQFDDFCYFNLNPKFCDRKEIVIRKSDFLSKRTLGINSTKSANELDRKIIKALKNPGCRMEVVFEVEA